MELEDIKPPPWQTIKEYVARSVATFVLLSKPLEGLRYGHTRNWIDFEVGLSCAEGKPVWVCEPQGQEVEFAVPHCTHYCIYDPTELSEVKRVKGYIDMYSGGVVGPAGHIGPAYTLLKAQSARCAKDDCQLEFHVMFKSKVDSFRCPSCRTRLYPVGLGPKGLEQPWETRTDE